MRHFEIGDYAPASFAWRFHEGIAHVTFNRPEKMNPLTFDAYDELRDLFENLAFTRDVKAVIVSGAGDNFTSGGDINEIIGPLARMDAVQLLAFTRTTGGLVKAIRQCPQPVIAAVDGVCTGAGAVIASAADLRVGTIRSKLAFLFVRVGVSGADMGACTLLPRLIGLSRATDLLMTGRVIGGEEAERIGFFNRLVDHDRLADEALDLAKSLSRGPNFGHAMTKTVLWQEWSMGLSECIESEAQAQSICMQTNDFQRAFEALSQKQKPVFFGD